jgi:translation initiation factor 1
MPNDAKTVYSTDHRQLSLDSGPTNKPHHHQPQPSTSRQDGIVRVRRETGGRQGKTVTAIYGLPLSDPRMEELAGELKRKCGTGGSVKDRVVLIQGDKTTVLIPILENLGYTVKKSGG